MLFTLTVSVLREVIEGIKVRSRCGAALKGPTNPCAGVEGPAPASSLVWGQAGPKLIQVTSMDFIFPLSSSVLKETGEMEEEAVSPSRPPSHCTQPGE